MFGQINSLSLSLSLGMFGQIKAGRKRAARYCVTVHEDSGQPLIIESVLVHEKVFPSHRMCSLTVECVPICWSVFADCRLCSCCQIVRHSPRELWSALCYRMCFLTIECVPLRQNMLSYYRMCSLTIEHVLTARYFYCRMCSLTVECVLLQYGTSLPTPTTTPLAYYRVCSLTFE